MLRDVFYYGAKPNAHPREQHAKNLADARNKCTTDHFWIINEFCDYRNFDWDFDFDFLPDKDVWAEDHINVWPSQHQKDSGTWLCANKVSEIVIYRTDVNPLIRKNEINDNWKLLEKVDTARWDFSWHPDPTDPPYIYRWGCKFFPVEIKACIEYHVDGAKNIKYMKDIVPLLPNYDCIKEYDKIDYTKFDMSWRPNPIEPPFIYVWGNKYVSGELRPTLEYHTPGATQKKYMGYNVPVLPEWNRWNIIENVDKTKFDFSWRPDPREPDFIYVWGNKYVSGELRPTLEYHTPGATQKKYMEYNVPVLPEWNRWNIIENVDKTKFDFSWRPDPREPDFIYVFGNDQHDGTIMPTLEYHVPGATIKKYVTDIKAKLLPNPSKFIHLENSYGIDYSWVPDPTSPPYIYAWGNQWNNPEDKISIQYVVEGATEYKYMSERATRKPCLDNWVIPKNLDVSEFDFSWEPSPADPPYIYEFGTQWQKTGGPKYIVEGATEVKYIDIQKAKSLPDKSKWKIPNHVDTTNFDFSWHPDNTSPPYIYHFATQWALSGGPTYNVDGATEVKYMEEPCAVALPNRENWEIPNDINIDKFDFSWHPYVEDQPYIYQFGTQHQKTGGPRYITPGVIPSSPIKYIDTRILRAIKYENKSNFSILNNYKIKNFDWSWHPDDIEEPYIYVFGNNQYPAEIMPTIEYVVPGAKEIKYINEVAAILGEDRTNWVITQQIDESKFDFSWKPNPKDPPYIYRWGNKFISNLYKATIEYIVPGAVDVKYMSNDVEVVPEWEHWEIPNNLDTTNFDFTWRPDPLEPDFVWEFGTQHQKTGGPRYVIHGAIETKYIETQKVKALPNRNNWELPNNIDVKDFDFSWHPDNTSPPYIYHFATQWALSGGPIYKVQGATEVKYMEEPCAVALPNKENWEIPDDIDAESFDFSWHPYVEDQPYIYQFGTQHQKTGGPTYVTPGAIETSPIKYIDTRILKAKKLNTRKNFSILNNYKIKNFDWSWHPDDTDDPYIYVFGNNQYPAEIMPTIEYVVQGATQIKYVNSITATLDIDMNNWDIPDYLNVDGFDFSWKPNPKDPPYIYEFGTQWQKTGGPRYVIPGATKTKYVTTQKVKALPNKENWEIPKNIDITNFDFSWHPDNTSPPYIYHFATQWALSGGPIYRVKDATEVKYMEEPCAVALPNKENWEIPDDIDAESFDFSWHPYVEDQPYIYQFGTQHQKTGGPRYITPGIILSSSPKYIDTRILKAKKLSNKSNFSILNNYKIKDFDYSWHPDSTEEPYIYVFGNNQYPAEVMPTIEYVISGARTIKYVHDIVAILDNDLTNWEIPNNIDVSNFDFSWKPNPKDPPYIYEFGTQWQKTGGPRYIVDGARQIKYVKGSKATSLSNKRNWILPKDIPIIEFDFSWHPDSTEDAYIYVFGTQWQSTAGPRYIMEGATEYKYINVNFAKAGPTEKNWIVPSDIELKSFDFSWHPHPDDPPYIYQFGTQHQKTGGPKYKVPGASTIKYIDHPELKGKRLSSQENWSNPNDSDVSTFDFSWHPDDTSPPYVYQFGTLLDRNDGPRYTTPNYIGEIVYLPRIEKQEEFIDEDENVIEETKSEESIELIKVNQYYIETTLDDLVQQHSNEVFWALNKNIDYTNFDFEWRPEIINVEWESEYIHVFGFTDSVATQTYFVNAKSYLEGYKDFKFVQNIKLNESTLSELFIKPDMFFVDKGNKESHDRFDRLKLKYSNIQKTRFLNSWVDTINRCINRSTTELCWILNSELDYTNFDFNYYPNPWQMKMVHVFGTQWNHWGTTFLINRETFPRDTKYIKIIEHLNNLNFVKDRIATASSITYDIFYINHGNLSESELTRLTDSDHIVDYENDYLTTFKKILSQLPEKKDHYIWIANTICDYSNFDFTYICDPFARDQLHVFPSDKQKFGDTFFVNVNKLREYIDTMNTLKDYKDINYNQTQRVKRLPAPTFVTAYDSHVLSVMEEFNFPYATFITEDNKQIDIKEDEPISLWDAESKTILITSTGGTRIVVPKEVKNYVETQLYDYPYIKTSTRLAKSNPLDIVFLSNGEKCADANYEHLLKVTKGLPNKITRVDGVNGRVAAYQSAAKASNTPWFFTVFAKLKINAKFDFNWQPDRLQIPKHYMFLAKNPVNGLIYGHQGLIAYNSQMVLNNFGEGLDFTLDSPHETIELLSGTATFNTDEFSTWRTAFREVIKLKNENSEISNKRLDIWLTKAEGDFAEYSLLGAKDGISFYKKCKGNLDLLRQSYEWKWLQEFYNKKHKKK